MLSIAPNVAAAATLLAQGKPVLVFDGERREREVDLFFAAQHATVDALHALRTHAGGLVFLAVDPEVGRKLGLPFLQDIFAEAAQRHNVLRGLVPNDIRYDARSSFSLTLNHRKTFTGITDEDRALTILEFARTAAESMHLSPERAQVLLGERFRAPGHVALCVAARGLLAERRGHTELGVALARIAGITPVLAGAEMLRRGTALAREDAAAWAEANGTVLVSGREIEAALGKLHAGEPASATVSP